MDPGVRERGSEDSGHVGARVQVTGFSTLCHLHMVIDLIHTFDKERENWTRFKHWYMRMEKNMARTLFNVICAVKLNIDFHNKGAKPPIDRTSFYKLMLCWEFKPFHQHLSESCQRKAKRHIQLIQFYNEMFNQEGQAQMAHQIECENGLTHEFKEGM